MDYFFIDGVAVLSLGYTMNLSNPQKKLRKVRLGFKQVDLCASDIVDALFIVTDVGKLSIYLCSGVSSGDTQEANDKSNNLQTGPD